MPWPLNLFGSSAKGKEYFLRNLLGTHNNVMGKDHAEGLKLRDDNWHKQAPEGCRQVCCRTGACGWSAVGTRDRDTRNR